MSLRRSCVYWAGETFKGLDIETSQFYTKSSRLNTLVSVLRKIHFVRYVFEKVLDTPFFFIITV